MARTEVESKTELGTRLREVRRALGDIDREEFAASLDISKSTIAFYERGERTPPADVLASYVERYKVDPEWLLLGVGSMFRTGAIALNEELEEFVRVPMYDVKASAGHGRLAVSQMPVSEVAFTVDFLRRLGGNPEYCYILEARGDSMWPTIQDGAMLIADASQTAIDDGRIYHFNVNERVLVKRARWRMDGRLGLTSDNASAGYPEETFAADRVDDLYVGGRIIFVGHAPLPVRGM